MKRNITITVDVDRISSAVEKVLEVIERSLDGSTASVSYGMGGARYDVLPIAWRPKPKTYDQLAADLAAAEEALEAATPEVSAVEVDGETLFECPHCGVLAYEVVSVGGTQACPIRGDVGEPIVSYGDHELVSDHLQCVVCSRRVTIPNGWWE